MTFGERIAYYRKQKNWSQSELGALVGTGGRIIGRYEREENSPSVEVALKIAQALGVTLDFLVTGTGAVADTQNASRIEQIQQLPEEDRQHILITLDALIRDAKARSAYK